MLAREEKARRKHRWRGDAPAAAPHAGAMKLVADGALSEILDLKSGGSIEDILQSALLDPVADLTSNPGKRLRGKLVHLAYRLANQGMPLSVADARRCKACAEVLELVHAGSLVVDDIEDGSDVRRGLPALHVRYGLSIALNAGNWLYFWPLELIRSLELPDETLLAIYQQYHRTLLRAHFGQAIDLGSRVDAQPQQRVPQICLAAMELKTGALVGLATFLGAALAKAPKGIRSALTEFGQGIGVALQMFDDLGNVLGIKQPEKRYEDLLLSRPSWAWACAANTSSAEGYQQFVSAVGQLPDARALESWIERHSLVWTMREGALQQLEGAFDGLTRALESQPVRWCGRTLEELRILGEEISRAYG